MLHLVDLMSCLAPGCFREGSQVIEGTAPEFDGFEISHWLKYTKFCMTCQSIGRQWELQCSFTAANCPEPGNLLHLACKFSFKT